MRRSLRNLSMTLIFITTCVAAYGQPNAFENKIVAVINEDVITQADLDIALSSIIAEYKGKYPGNELAMKIEEARQEILKQMIEDRLILQEAKRRGVVVEDAEIEERLNNVKSRFSSDTDFDEAIEDAGVTSDTLKNRYKELIMMSKLVNHEVREKVVVTPKEISDYYSKHANELKAPESVHLKAILILFEEENSESLVKQKSDDIYRLIKEGRDFSDLARQYSRGPGAQEGGDLGFIEKGQLRKEFDDAIFKLKVGEVSAPVKSQDGYYIFKVEDRKDSYVRSLDEVCENIENIIFQEKARSRYKEWIDKLKRDAFVQIK